MEVKNKRQRRTGRKDVRDMDMGLYRAIMRRMKQSRHTAEPFTDMIAMLSESYANEGREIHAYVAETREAIQKAMEKAIETEQYYLAENLEKLYYETYRIEAFDIFDSFCIFLEHKRKPSERFYEPRRKVLAPIVKSLQELADDELDELCISQPPRTGKTTIVMFFTLWMMLKYPNETNLYSSYSGFITKSFFDGILELMEPEEYAFREIAPYLTVPTDRNKMKSADLLTINLDRHTRYPTLTCRSVGSTMNGCCDASKLIIGDDLIGTIEEALNPDRLRKAWMFVENDMLPRSKEKCKYLWIGTRWSVHDPEGERLRLLQENSEFSDRKWRFLNLPALDENDESNFEYDYDVGFSTKTYRMRRASFAASDDMASWLAQYQGEPIEREGVLFTSGVMNYFSELPEEQPDRVFFAVDPAFGGGDYVAGPVCYMYGKNIYVVDVIYDKREKNITQPEVAGKIRTWSVKVADFEATKATSSYAEGVRKRLDDMGVKCTIRTHSAPPTKRKSDRIWESAPDIRERFYFRFENDRSKEYQLFMTNVFSYTITGKNKHDDAPDSLAMAARMAFDDTGRIEIFRREF